MIRSYKTEGIIIKRRNFGEADRILTVFTKYNGKIQVRAPGVRRITSRRSSHIELLNCSLVTLYKSSRYLFPILTEAQALEEFLPIKNNLAKVGFAYYTCELVNRLCPENQENQKVFFLLKDTLYRLASSHPELVSGSPFETKEMLNQVQYDTNIIEDFEDELLVSLGFLPKLHKLRDKNAFIEEILEGKIITKRLLPLFLDSY